ncbi:pilus assembly protein [Variovorax ginsengisoli]|uniref:Type IV pilus assembly protein PilY1 n=1 Tax=Variovorax ginsengisoli TaxID=363844 RepID=A0ABT9SE69_9BURK|nr:PilC/PilY family type IV pilus protein [Variovorax ginsengisoli]MDP9902665.1 type IV pilus assembly protein PilY1 [Variovorax ginsengisoli]
MRRTTLLPFRLRIRRPVVELLCAPVCALLCTQAPASAAPLHLSTSPDVATPERTGCAPAFLSGMVASASTTRTDSVGFVASYDPGTWSGQVTAYQITAQTGAMSTTGRWGTQPATATQPATPVSTASRLDAGDVVPDARTVLSSRADGAAVRGIAWTWDALSAAQQASLGSVGGKPDAQGGQRLAYLRGERSQEHRAGGMFRDRDSRHGDIVNSRPWLQPGQPADGHAGNDYAAFRTRHAGRTPMLYVGANDGMLHGFAAEDGREKLAYVPLGLYPRLARLSTPGYTHSYFVDGSPFTADVFVAGAWKTYLALFLGAGGRGYAVLDVSEPARFATAAPENLLVLDQTATTDADLGHVFAEPVRERGDPTLTRQIARLNDGRWALVIGNGYNSASEKAVLLVQYLDGDREIRRITTPAQAGDGHNGLAAPRLIDLNGDLTPDVAYAGDLQGRLWKFDLSSANADEWQVAFDGQPFFTAMVPDLPGVPQPITSAPAWTAHPEGGLTVVFGTGRLLTDDDRSDRASQSVYGLHDDTRISRAGGRVTFGRSSGPIAGGRDQLTGQTLNPATGARTPALAALSSTAVAFTGDARRRGWYLDLPAGERVIANPTWFDGQLVDVPSMRPDTLRMPREASSHSAGSCPTADTTAQGARTFRTTLNAIDGQAPRSRLYADDTANSAGGFASRDGSGIGVDLADSATHQAIAVCPPGQTCVTRLLRGRTLLRPSWRQLQ